ncbi:MAG: UxaA family hydrolase [Dehalococcoidia bacterium]|nr:UxaA family hydrolase [Dehalococcoidia bacterium]
MAKERAMEFLGYERPDGSAGARNYVALIPASRCANELADRIAGEVGGGVVALLHNYACVSLKPDSEKALRALIGLGSNANVAATVVVGIGCDGIPAPDIAEGIARTGKAVELITIEKEGSYQAALDTGMRLAKEMLADASRIQRRPFDLSHLVFGSKCTGSTPASIIACNPTVGWAADTIVAQGGSMIFSETAEIIGAEHILARRAADEATARRIHEVADRMENRMKESGVDIRGSQPVPGNIRGGMTTLEEKSLGAIAKSGTSLIQGVLEWGERPKGKGLFFMDGSANTPQIFLGLAAGGAQIMSLNYGGGLPARFRNFTVAVGGIPIVPVLKVLSSPKDFDQMEYFDIYAGSIIEGRESVSEVGDRLLAELIAVASGKPCKQEMHSRYREPLDMYTTGPLL